MNALVPVFQAPKLKVSVESINEVTRTADVAYGDVNLLVKFAGGTPLPEYGQNDSGSYDHRTGRYVSEPIVIYAVAVTDSDDPETDSMIVKLSRKQDALIEKLIGKFIIENRLFELVA